MKRSLRSILSKDLRRSIKEQISTKKNNDSKNSDTFVSSIIVLNDVSLKETDLDPIIEVTPLQKTSSEIEVIKNMKLPEKSEERS